MPSAKEKNGQVDAPAENVVGGSRFTVRHPTIRDAKNFTVAVASANINLDTAAMAEEGEREAAMLLMLKDALSDPRAMEGIMAVFADLWEYEPPISEIESEEPPEDWEYDPPSDMVERGQLIGRDERWRSLSKRQRKRLVKQVQLEGEGFEAIGEFIESLRELPYIKDFFTSSESASTEGTGTSSTPSKGATGGKTRKQNPSIAPAPDA